MAINKVSKDLFKEFNITNFVETGIYQGLTIGIVERYFNELGYDDWNILGVDIHQPYIDANRAKYPDHRIDFVTSDSGAFTKGPLHESFASEGRTLFFLDAHVHCGIGSNPLYTEVAEIIKLQNKPIIMIDDFVNPMNPTHNWTWGPMGEKLGIDSIREIIKDKTDIAYYPIEGEHETCQGQGIIFVDEYEADLVERLKNIEVQGERI